MYYVLIYYRINVFSYQRIRLSPYFRILVFSQLVTRNPQLILLINISTYRSAAKIPTPSSSLQSGLTYQRIFLFTYQRIYVSTYHRINVSTYQLINSIDWQTGSTGRLADQINLQSVL